MDASADGEFFLRDIGEDPTSTNHFPSDFRHQHADKCPSNDGFPQGELSHHSPLLTPCLPRLTDSQVEPVKSGIHRHSHDNESVVTGPRR
jgi:hypothetical protein